MGTHHFSFAACAALLLGFQPQAAQAQLADGTIVDILRECRKITDGAARIACYDNIPIGQQVAAADAVLPTPPLAPRASTPATEFGSNQLPAPREQRTAQTGRIEAAVTQAREGAPGMWRLTLDNGSQWELVDAAPSTYDPPRHGSNVEISSASMGSYLMRYGGQQGLRIRRVK